MINLIVKVITKIYKGRDNKKLKFSYLCFLAVHLTLTNSSTVASSDDPEPMSQIYASDKNNFLVFDKIGQISSSTSYIHVMIPVNLSAISYEAQPMYAQFTRMITMQTSNLTHIPVVKSFQDIASLGRQRIRSNLDRVSAVEQTLPTDGSPYGMTYDRIPRAWPLIVAAVAPAIAKALLVTFGVGIIVYSIVASVPEQPNTTPPPTQSEKLLDDFEYQLRNALDKNFKTQEDFKTVMNASFAMLPDAYKGAFNKAALKPPPRTNHEELTELENIEAHTRMMEDTIKQVHQQTKDLQKHPYILVPPVLRFTRDSIPNYPEVAEYTELFLNLVPADHEPLYFPESYGAEGDFIVDRDRRFVKAILNAVSIIGTFLGYMSQAQISILRGQHEHLEGKHNLLVYATGRQDNTVATLVNQMDEIREVIEVQSRLDTALIQTRIDNTLTQWERRTDLLISTIQQLQNHRMAVGYLSVTQMELLHERVTELAKEQGLNPLTTKLSDYFQIDASYFRNGKDVVMILHVPCTDPNNLLDLYRFISFPIPSPSPTLISDRTLRESLLPPFRNNPDGSIHSATLPKGTFLPNALYIQPESDMIAISQRQHYRIISPSDLLHCDKNSDLYLCDEMNALRLDLNQTCLGALFFRSSSGMAEHCSFTHRPAKEEVVQLANNQFLVYSPTLRKAQVTCANKTSFHAHLGEVTKLKIPMGCQVKLENHIITPPTHFSLHPDATIFTWNLDPLSLPAHLFTDAPYLDAALFHVSDSIRQLKNWTHNKVDNLSAEVTLDKEFGEMLSERLLQPHLFAIVIWSAISLILAVILGLAVYVLVKHITRKPRLTLNDCITELQKLIPPEKSLRDFVRDAPAEATEDSSSTEDDVRYVRNRY